MKKYQDVIASKGGDPSESSNPDDPKDVIVRDAYTNEAFEHGFFTWCLKKALENHKPDSGDLTVGLLAEEIMKRMLLLVKSAKLIQESQSNPSAEKKTYTEQHISVNGISMRNNLSSKDIYWKKRIYPLLKGIDTSKKNNRFSKR